MKKWEEIIKEKIDEPSGNLPESVFEEFHARLEAGRSAAAGRAGSRSAKRRPLLWALAPAAAAGLAAVLLIRQPAAPEDAVQVVQQPAAPVSVTPFPTEPVQSLESPESIEPSATVRTPRRVSHTIAPDVEIQQPASSTDDTENFISTESAEGIGGADRTDEAAAYEPIVTPQTEDQPDNSFPESVFPSVSPYKPHDNAVRPVMMKIAPAAGIVTGGGLLAAVVSSLLGHDFSAVGAPNAPCGYLDGDLSSVGRFGSDTPFGKDKLSGEISHHPALFKGGLSVGIPFSDRFKIVTGLEYSRYRSDFGWHFSGGTTVGEKRQVVRYLGVPLRLDWSLAKNHMFDVYVGAGAQADYCIGADLIDSRTKEAHRIDAVKRDGFIFSLLVAGGIQVNVHKLIGLYLEPELVWTGGKPTKAEENYYPWYVNGLLPGPDNTKLQTYRTEHPFMFSVSTGLRINLGK